MQLSRWDNLSKKYDSKDAAIFFVYSHERHPGERGYREYEHTQTGEERMAYARMWSERTDLAVAVDGVDDRVLKAYGAVPNPAFVIDRKGTLVFKETWADAAKVERVIDRLLVYEKSANR